MKIQFPDGTSCEVHGPSPVEYTDFFQTVDGRVWVVTRFDQVQATVDVVRIHADFARLARLRQWKIAVEKT